MELKIKIDNNNLDKVYSVYVDNEKKCEIINTNVVSLPLTSKEHIVQLKSKIDKSKKIKIKATSNKEIIELHFNLNNFLFWKQLHCTLKPNKSNNNIEIISNNKKILLGLLGILLIIMIPLIIFNSNKKVLDGIYSPEIDKENIDALLKTPAILILYSDGIEFYQDGTCKALGDLKDNIKCTYKYNNKQFNVVFDDYHFDFLVESNHNLKDQFGYFWHLTENKNTNNSKDMLPTSNKLKNGLDLSKQYYVVGTSDGNHNAYIQFNADGTCLPNFTNLSNKASLNNEIIYIQYPTTNLDCKYTINNNIISINWLGTVKEIYEFYLGNNQKQQSTISEQYIMKDIEFEYFPEKDYIDVVNGEWKLTPGENFFIITFEKKGENISNEKENFNSSLGENNNQEIPDNDFDNESENNNSNNFETSNKTEPALINNVYSQISQNQRNKSVSINVNSDYQDVKDFIKIFKINGKEYPVGEWAILDLYQVGQNCYNIEIQDNNGNDKNMQACYDFFPDDPKFNIVIQNNCDIRIWKDGFYERGDYNQLSALKWYLDDKLFTSELFTYENDSVILLNNKKLTPGQHTIKGINQFGIETSKTFEFDEKCLNDN